MKSYRILYTANFSRDIEALSPEDALAEISDDDLGIFYIEDSFEVIEIRDSNLS